MVCVFPVWNHMPLSFSQAYRYPLPRMSFSDPERGTGPVLNDGTNRIGVEKWQEVQICGP